MAKVKVLVLDRQTDGRTDRRMRFNVPTLSRKRGTIRCNAKYYVIEQNAIDEAFRLDFQGLDRKHQMLIPSVLFVLFSQREGIQNVVKLNPFSMKYMYF